MKDAEVRTAILRHLYKTRDDEPPDELEPEQVGLSVSKVRLTRVLFDLREHGLAKGTDDSASGDLCLLSPRITARGVDVVEGTERSPVAMTLDQSTTYNVGSVAGTAVQVGSGNTQNVYLHFQQLAQAIEAAPISDDQKRSMKNRILDLLSHPAAPFVIPSVGELIGLFT